ncbi:MAG: hypothetical protein PF549_00985 [Patescibacteria group bacterium]|jgi:hypothetical protein|nr:hypothetical protein [Patescibacteria group bacterium]
MKEDFLIKIFIEESTIRLRLMKNEEVIDEKSWQEKANLSLKLLLNIDKLLEKNKIKKEQLNNIEVESDQSISYSSTRIARAVAEAEHYCLTN